MVETVNDQPAYKVSLRYCFETFEKKGNGTVEIWMKKFSKEDSSCHMTHLVPSRTIKGITVTRFHGQFMVGCW